MDGSGHLTELEKEVDSFLARGPYVVAIERDPVKKTFKGRVTLWTRISHSANELKDYLIGPMASQCCLRPTEFRSLVDCSLTESDWDSLLEERYPESRQALPKRPRSRGRSRRGSRH